MSETDAVPAYREWAPAARTSRFLACTWVGSGASGPDVEPVLPDGCMDIIWDGVRLFVAGPDTGPVLEGGGGPIVVGVRFRPGTAPAFLGPPADELRDIRVGLDCFWPDAAALAQRLGEAPSPAAVRAVLEGAITARLGEVSGPDPAVEAATRTWARRPSRSVADLAQVTGLSERRLHRRFVASVGYGPKFLQRVLRFQGFLGSCGTSEAGLAELAYRWGYADQAHLNRDALALSGRTPARLQASRAGVDVRNVQDAGADARLHLPT